MKAQSLLNLRRFIGTTVFFLSLSNAIAAPSSLSPEQRFAEIARSLKPIPENVWQEIAGTKFQETYEVTSGDTLSDISKRLFGDPKYWPKLWAINNSGILNPHEIVPGEKIAFLSGSGQSLPQLQMSGSEPFPIPARTSRKKARSGEWANLPRQRWEIIQLALPPNVDQNGFDKNSRIKSRVRPGFELDAFATDSPIEPLGKIVAGKSESTFVSSGDVVFIHSEEELQVGETYSLTKEPATLKSRLSDRVGYSYPIIGRVKIVGVKDGLYIGALKNGKSPVFRGALVVPFQKRVGGDAVIPATESTEGVLLFDRELGSFATAQHKTVFVDRGTEDGVKPGMVFRAYEHYDPSTEKRITESDFIVAADLKVVHVSEHFCTAVIMTSPNVVHENQRVILLTDVTELLLQKKYQVNSSFEERPRENELDRLDSLDNSGLGTDEKKELKQLESWKNNPEAIAPPSADLLPATEGAPPPPEPAPPTAPEVQDSTPPPPAAEENTLDAVPPPPPPPPAEDATGDLLLEE